MPFDDTQVLVEVNECVAVCLPTYFGSTLLPTTVKSLLGQTHQNFKVYVRDDTPPEAAEERRSTEAFISSLNDSRFEYVANTKNLGYPQNLIALVNGTYEDMIFLLAQDDVLSPIAIESCVQSFLRFPSAAAVGRPYYWYFNELESPVRQIVPLEGAQPHLITTDSPMEDILLVLLAASQLTGLAYRKSMLTVPFVDSIFPAHIYPFAGALRDHGVVYLPLNTVAVSIQDSQTRKVSSIYDESPAKAWVGLYESVFNSDKYRQIRDAGIRGHMGKNYIGLVQIRTYAKYKYFLRESFYMARIRPFNVFSLSYWMSVIALAILPRRIIQLLVDNYKTKILSRKLIDVHLARLEEKWW
jgi:glycosyltransferase involved in cell wall biosynthesis